MKSQLVVKSEFGKGSTFSFTLKVSFFDEEVQTIKTAKENSKGTIKTRNKHKKILIVEDHDVNMKVTEKLVMMITEKAEILKAKDGKQALELYQQWAPDIILLDIRLPDINGYEVSTRIRETNQKVPIIALTAMAVKNEKEKCLSVGMNHYLSKPLDLEKVREILQDYL